MAKPRVFISSTYYDFRSVRANLERFVKEIGYEPVLFEKGHIPYGKDDALEEYCYREIANCDIVVTIIGGKYGTQSNDEKNSITQKELLKALEMGKQLYVFIERSVLSEYRTFTANRNVEGFIATAVNDIKIYAFIEKIYDLPSGNPIEGFDVSDDIIRYLRDQWAGLFQRMLSETPKKTEVSIVDELKSTSETLKNIASVLAGKIDAASLERFQSLLLASHPAFNKIKSLMGIKHRVIFFSLDELKALMQAKGYEYDHFTLDDESHEWDNRKIGKGIRICKSIFDDNDKLKTYLPNEWDESWIGTYPIKSQPEQISELPF